jgi:hypothetical protein
MSSTISTFRHPVHVQRQCQLAGQIGHDHHRALQHTDQQQVFSRIIGLDAAGELGDPRVDLGLCIEHAREVVGNVTRKHGAPST